MTLQNAGCRWRPVPSATVLRISRIVRSPKSVFGGIRQLLIFIAVSTLAVCCMTSPAAAAISCTISMTNVVFGSIDVLPGSPIDTTATATINCSGANANTTYRFCTDIRTGTDVSGNQRRMASGTNTLNFDLYKDAGHTQQWGNYTNNFLGGGNQVDFTSNGAGIISAATGATVTVFARVPGQSTARPASYSESMNGGGSNDLQYGALASAGSCPIGGSTSQYSFTVTAMVVSSCNVSATTHTFGSILNLTANVDATSTVTATCTSNTSYNIGLDAGTGSGATVTTRKMTSGANTINYSLYRNAARTQVWGTTIGTNTVSGTGTGAAQPVTAFGRVPSQTTPAPAAYSDTIITTVTY